MSHVSPQRLRGASVKATTFGMSERISVHMRLLLGPVGSTGRVFAFEPSPQNSDFGTLEADNPVDAIPLADRHEEYVGRQIQL